MGAMEGGIPMAKSPDTQEFTKDEIESRIYKIIERDPKNGPMQVVLLIARCGFRVLPLLVKEGGLGFWFKREQRKHLVACWRALIIPVCFTAGRPVSSRLANIISRDCSRAINVVVKDTGDAKLSRDVANATAT